MDVEMFGHEDSAFEPSCHRSTSPIGSPLIAAAPFRKMVYTVSSLIKELEIRDQKIR